MDKKLIKIIVIYMNLLPFLLFTDTKLISEVLIDEESILYGVSEVKLFR